MNFAELMRLDGLAQAALLRRGEVTPRELALAAIQGIARINPSINAVTCTRYEQALHDAPAAAAECTAEAPFYGVPFLLKDLGVACADVPTTAGSAFLQGFVPRHNAELTQRFRRVGLVLLGKTNTAEFGALPTTEPRFTGATRNPWSLGRSSGGSSGGAAAAVAARLVPVAHASDAGGSIRIPAACCGVFGLKPTRARVPLGPDVGDLMNGLVTAFVVSRSVRDSAAMLDAVSGPALGDPYCAPPARGSFLDAALSPPARRQRVVVTVDEKLHPECARAVEQAAALVAALGHEVVAAAPPVRFSDVRELFLLVWAAGVSSAISGYAAVTGRTPTPELLEEVTWWLYERGQSVSAAQYLTAITRLQQAARRLAAFHQEYDAQLSAVTAQPAPPLGVLSSGPAQERLARALDFVADTPLANLTGQPAMSVPLYHDADGVPVGVHFTGGFGDESGLLALAAELEEAQPWADRIPTVSAASDGGVSSKPPIHPDPLSSFERREVHNVSYDR